MSMGCSGLYKEVVFEETQIIRDLEKRLGIWCFNIAATLTNEGCLCNACRVGFPQITSIITDGTYCMPSWSGSFLQANLDMIDYAFSQGWAVLKRGSIPLCGSTANTHVLKEKQWVTYRRRATVAEVIRGVITN